MIAHKKHSISKDKNLKIISEKKDVEIYSIDEIKSYLHEIIPTFSSKNYELVQKIFGKREDEFLSLIQNVLKENRSDSIICYGNNNQVLKVFLDKAMENYGDELNFVKIQINGYFDTNEETLLKDICAKLGISSKAGYNNYKKELDNYFMKKTQDDSMIVIYCDYIDHLVRKKKQRLLYTLFELVNNSKNILFIGFTYNYNLMEQMEKRIRSRSSQKTMYINIQDFEDVINAIEKAFQNKIFSEKYNEKLSEEQIESNKKYGDLIYNILINDENIDYTNYIEKLVKLGTSIDGILTKIQQHLVFVKARLEHYRNKHEKNTIDKEAFCRCINKVTSHILDEEKNGYTLNMLLKCSKFQLTLFICLTACVSQYRDKIQLNTFYNKYKSLLTSHISKRSKYDLILIQKYLEDLNNSNLISIINNEKYGKLYQLKLPLCEIKRIMSTLRKNNKLDSEMIKLCDNIKW